MKFTDSKKPRRVKIVVPNKALYGRDGDNEIMEPWLQARGFIAPMEERHARLVA